MKRKLQAVVSKKRLKFSHVPKNQSLITNHFVLATPNSLLNVGHITDFEANNDEDIVLHKRNKRVIVEDEEDADSTLSRQDNVQARGPKSKYKYADRTFFNLIASFYQNSADKLARVPKAIRKQANELVCLEIPNITKAQAYNIVEKCGMQCRGGVNMFNGKKTCINASVVKNQNAINNPNNNPKNNPKNNPQKTIQETT